MWTDCSSKHNFKLNVVIFYLSIMNALVCLLVFCSVVQDRVQGHRRTDRVTVAVSRAARLLNYAATAVCSHNNLRFVSF